MMMMMMMIVKNEEHWILRGHKSECYISVSVALAFL